MVADRINMELRIVRSVAVDIEDREFRVQILIDEENDIWKYVSPWYPTRPEARVRAQEMLREFRRSERRNGTFTVVDEFSSGDAEE